MVDCQLESIKLAEVSEEDFQEAFQEGIQWEISLIQKRQS